MPTAILVNSPTAEVRPDRNRLWWLDQSRRKTYPLNSSKFFCQDLYGQPYPLHAGSVVIAHPLHGELGLDVFTEQQYLSFALYVHTFGFQHLHRS